MTINGGSVMRSCADCGQSKVIVYLRACPDCGRADLCAFCLDRHDCSDARGIAV